MRAKEVVRKMFEDIKSNWYLPVTEWQVYSEGEQKIGVWTDGKPIYRKVIKRTNTSAFQIDANIEQLIAVSGAFIQNDGNMTPFFYFPNSTTGYNDYIVTGYIRNTDKNYVPQLGAASQSLLGTIYYVFEYTKTTDTAATTPKVPFEPLHEWSTEEKLVGYWIDGKAVYQRTVVGKTPSSVSADMALVDVSSWGIDKVIYIEGCFDGGGGAWLSINCFHSSNVNAMAHINDRGQLVMRIEYSGHCNRDVCVIVTYTKTT